MRLLRILLVGGILLTFAMSSTAAPPWMLFGGAVALHTPGAGERTWSITLVSNTGDAFESNDFSGVAHLSSDSPMVFGSLWYLSTDFNVGSSDCFGGSPRFQLNIDVNDDGVWSVGDKNVFVYIGPMPNFVGCNTVSGWQTTGNLIPDPGATQEARWDTSQLAPGTQYNTYSGTAALVGSHRMLGIQLVVDSGWGFASGIQTIDVDRVTVNDFTLNARGVAK